MLLPYLRLEVKFALTRTSTPNRIPRGPSWWVDAGSLPQHDICYKMKISKTRKYPYIPMASHGFPLQKIMKWRFGISMHIICISPIFVDAKMGSKFFTRRGLGCTSAPAEQLVPADALENSPKGTSCRISKQENWKDGMQEIDAHKIISCPRTSLLRIYNLPHYDDPEKKDQGNNTQQSDKTYPPGSRNNGPYIYISYIYIYIPIFTIQCSFHNSNSTHSTVAFNGKPWWNGIGEKSLAFSRASANSNMVFRAYTWHRI